MKFSKQILVALSATTFLFPVTSFAVTELEPVVVSATRSAQSNVTTASNITIITEKDIAQSGAQHIVEILSTQAAIQINDLYGDGTRAQVNMRGFGDNAKSNTLILIDGRRLNHIDLGAPDLSSISLKDVKQIEIIQGSAGTLYGDQAVGGVINIITKSSDSEESHVAIEAGSFSRTSLKGSVSKKVNNLSYRFSAEQQNAANYRDHNEHDYLNLLGRIDFKSGNDLYFYDAQVINEQLNLPGSLTKTQVHTDPTQGGLTYKSDHNNSKTKIQRIGVKSEVNTTWSLEAEYTLRNSDIKGKAFNNDFTQNRAHQGFTPRLIGALPDNNGREILITMGIDYDTYSYDYSNPASFGSKYNYSKQQSDAVYIQSIIPVSDNTEITVGGRYAQVKYDITEEDYFPSGTSIKNKANAYELGLSYRASGTSRYYARIDGNYRFAKVDENTYTPSSVPYLEPQTGNSLEIGGEWSKKDFSAKATAYILNLKNEIDYDSTSPGPGAFSGANVNLDPTKRTGFTLEGNQKITSKFSISAQYGYIDGKFNSGSFEGNDIPFVSKHKFTINAAYKMSKAFSGTAELNYISDRFQASDYKNEKDKLPELTLLNLHARYTKNNWLISLRLNNITNESYSGYATFDGYYPAPERNFMAKFQYNF